MKWANIITIAKKDLLEVRQNKSAWMPMIIIPVIFVLLLPLGVLLLPRAVGEPIPAMLNDPDLQTFFANMPAGMRAQLAGLDEAQSMVLLMLGYMFAPFFLMLPLMFSTIIGAESFAGERERKTLEALLYSAASDAELFLGKVAAAITPAIAISWFSFVGYTLVLNIAGYPIFGRIWFPLDAWWPLIFWVTPALAVFGIAITVLISKKEQTFMGAYQASASTVVLVLGLLVGQIFGVVYLNTLTGLLIGLVLWLVDAVLMTLAVRTFNRTALLAGGS